MSPSRTLILSSTLPILMLLGLVAIAPVRAFVGADGTDPVPIPSSGPAELRQSSAITHGSDPAAVAAPVAPEQVAPDLVAPDPVAQAESVRLLRRSIEAGHKIAFRGTEVVSVWHSSGSLTRVLDLEQEAGGVRTATARDATAGVAQVSASVGDGLAGLSERALTVLAAGYQLRPAGSEEVAGRTATVVVASRSGREAARLWLDDQTGLLLRQDVRDGSGRLHRMAAFLDLQVLGVDGPSSTVGDSAQLGADPSPLSSGIGFGPARPPADAIVAWQDVVTPAELAALRADGWPSPESLAAGFVLLDARRGNDAAGRSTLHLTYGDGLSAISVFLQPGELDHDQLHGLSRRQWGDTEVFVRDGWPEVLVWQGGSMVITAVGDVEPVALRSALSPLPRQPNDGTLGTLQQKFGTALAWFWG